MKKIISACLSLALLAGCLPMAAHANTQSAAAVSGYVSATEGEFTLVNAEKTPAIYVDASDYEGVVRAAGDLKEDIKTVTGKEPVLANVQADADVIIGTVGKSAAVDALAESGELDISGIEGKWESFTIQNVDGKLVIAGSDKRGTIYGIYDLSEKIGVSPWYFWADVQTGHADALYITLPDGGYTEGEPSVKYRGIFLNDEFNMSEWSKSMGNTGKNMNNATYEKLFELLLRLKANYLWPAMHTYSTAFNNTEGNAELADKYGIVMGSSHCEPLLRNNLGELYNFQQEWTAANPDKKLYINTTDDAKNNVSWMWTDKDGSGNAVDNKEFLTDYWRARVKANGGYENTYTIGMRGVHDGKFSTNMDSKTAMTEILAAQRQIITEELCSDGKEVTDIPQIFIPYKEMLDLYNGGLNVPEDVTLMWPDDNFGYIRQLPTETERERSGGAGIYYHLSYFGRPTSYLWLSATQPGLIREEMTKAYDMGAQKIWVANVGDLKPAETEIEYFLDLARDVETVRNTDIGDWLKDNAKRDFGFDDAQASEYADIKLGYYEIANSRRPEHMVEGMYSLTDFGDEGQKTLDRYTQLETRATELYNSLDEAAKPSFYELMLYPIKGAHAMAEKYVYADKAKQYAENGWGSAVNKYAALSDAAQDKITSDTAAYTSMLGGKWDKMMNPFQTQLKGSFGGPITGKLAHPTVTQLGCTNMEIVPEGGQNYLTFTNYSTEPKFIDLINTGIGSFEWKAETTGECIKLNKTSGTVADNDRIYVSIDQSKVNGAFGGGYIEITRYVGETAVETQRISVTYFGGEINELTEKTYAESDGYVSVEAEHYTNSVKNGEYEWKIEKDFGRSGDSVKIYPDTAKTVSNPNKDNSAYLEYNVYFTTSGTFPIDVYRMPTINELSGATMRCRIGIDETTPVQFNGNTKTTDNSTGADAWGKGVLQNTQVISGTITVPSSGMHTIRLYNESPGVVIDKFVITTGEKKASYYGAPESYNTTYNNEMKPLPEPSVASEEQTGDITALFSPKLFIKNAEPAYSETEGINLENGSMTVKIASTLTKDAQCYVAAYNENGTLANLEKSANTITAGSEDRVFTFAGAAEKPSGGSLRAFVWTDKMEPVYTFSEPEATGIKADVIKLGSVDSSVVAAASYDDNGNMLNATYTTVDFSDTAVNTVKQVELQYPSAEGISEVQVMTLADLTDYEPLSMAVTLNKSDISLTASYENGYAYPAANMKKYIGREAVCVIEEADENNTISYIRQNTVAEDTYNSVPFNKQGKFKLKIKVAGAEDIIEENLSTIKNISADTDPVTTELYKQTFDTEPNDGKVTITSPAAYDSANKCVKMTSSAASGGAVTVDLGDSVKGAQGDTIVVKSDIAYGNLRDKYMNYEILDSAGNAILSSKINRYTGKTQSLTIGGVEQLTDGAYPSSIPKIDNNATSPSGKYATYVTTINISTGEVTVTINDKNKYEGKLSDNSSYDVQKLSFTTDYNNAGRTCYVDNIIVSKTKDKSYTMKFIPTVSGTETAADSITVTDKLTNAVIQPEIDGTYKLCDGLYSYTIEAGGKTVTKDLELSPATDSKTILVDMETGSTGKPE